MSGYTSNIIEETAIEKMADILKAISHPTRLQIVILLMNGELSVNNLCEQLGTKQSLTSQQLSILKYRGLVRSQRNGNVVHYSLNHNGINKIVKAIIRNTK